MIARIDAGLQRLVQGPVGQSLAGLGERTLRALGVDPARVLSVLTASQEPQAVVGPRVLMMSAADEVGGGGGSATTWTREKVAEVYQRMLAKALGEDVAASATEDTIFVTGLGLNSLHLGELNMAVELVFAITVSDAEVMQISKVGEAIDLIYRAVQGREVPPAEEIDAILNT